MAYIRGKTLFFTTSPRTPARMIPEIALLASSFEGCSWNKETQVAFMKKLVEQDFYTGAEAPSDPAFSARDRINRSPKALGFLDLNPTIALTDAGNEYVNGSRQGETLLRQLLKFQLPSPFHKLSSELNQDFSVKPYLEIIRLIKHFGSLAFDELMLFGMQLTSIHRLSEIIEKIDTFRKSKATTADTYRVFFGKYCESEIETIYSQEINSGQTSVRESDIHTAANFIHTKRRNLRDYTDACFRYLRATEIVSISQSGHSLSIAKDRKIDVEFILGNVSREPVFIDDETGYKSYLFDSTLPKLHSDDRATLVSKIALLDPSFDTERKTISQLKDAELVLRAHRKLSKQDTEIMAIKNYRTYDDINDVFDGIVRKRFYDNPLMFEWNAWRAMTMLDGGEVEGNFNLDDNYQPLSTAAGNTPDILCDYGDFDLLVEVTLQTGQKQYDNEGEPVARHVGRHKELVEKATYCLFIAPTISRASVAHFYGLHKILISLYGGTATIVPMELSVFRKMVQDSYMAPYIPDPSRVKALFEQSKSIADTAVDENDWYQKVTAYALNWLTV
ncbi:MAG: AlwI family type II restriction endonuclease [Coriobacteriales bacterium]|nr:AlwI family type II restriction endonuclease [Coriobacteriales bacterium]